MGIGRGSYGVGLKMRGKIHLLRLMHLVWTRVACLVPPTARVTTLLRTGLWCIRLRDKARNIKKGECGTRDEHVDSRRDDRDEDFGKNTLILQCWPGFGRSNEWGRVNDSGNRSRVVLNLRPLHWYIILSATARWWTSEMISYTLKASSGRTVTPKTIIV